MALEYLTVCETGAVPEGNGVTIEVGGKLVALFRVGDCYYAIDDVCPHMGASLGEGEVDKGIVTCPWHAWRFRLADGAWADNPRIKIGSYPVRVLGNQVQIQIETNPPAAKPNNAQKQSPCE
jgi:nitrite reductase (NADH) small subunit/3-phenylpropionate/trans-cinnamate dioxygenase ferredoxin subunit